VEVRAQNRAGWSEWVPVPVLEDARTPVPVAPSVVRSLRVQEVAGALRVTWAGPAADGGAPPEFDVQVRRVDNDGEWATACADLGARTLVCQIGADAIGDGWGELHEVRVRARNSQGASDWVVSGPGLFTPFTVPDPSGLDVYAAARDRSLLAAVGPEDLDEASVARGGPVIRYEIRAVPTSGATRVCSVARSRTGELARSCQIGGLANGVTYQVQLRLQNRAGWSPWQTVAADGQVMSTASVGSDEAPTPMTRRPSASGLVHRTVPQWRLNTAFFWNPRFSPEIAQTIVVDQGLELREVHFGINRVTYITDPDYWSKPMHERGFNETTVFDRSNIAANVTVSIWRILDLEHDPEGSSLLIDDEDSFVLIASETMPMSLHARMSPEVMNAAVLPTPMELSAGRYLISLHVEVEDPNILTLFFSGRESGTNTLANVFGMEIPTSCWEEGGFKYTFSENLYPEGRAYVRAGGGFTEAAQFDPKFRFVREPGLPNSLQDVFNEHTAKVSECSKLGGGPENPDIMNPGDLDLRFMGVVRPDLGGATASVVEASQTSESSVRALMRIDGRSDIAAASARIWRDEPSGPQIVPATCGPASLVEGTPREGFWSVECSIGGEIDADGSYFVEPARIRSADGSVSFLRARPDPSASSGVSFDVSGPEIVEVLPDGGVFGPGEVFTVSVTVRDQSGIATVGFSFDQVFRDEVGEVESTFQRDFCGQSLVRSGVDEGAGTETWTFECTVPDVVVGGEYRIRVFALDTLGNWTNSNGGRIQDVFGAFTIVGGSDDVSGPEIVEVLPDGGVFGPGEVFTVSVTVRDQSGIATVGFSFDQVFRDEVGEVESTFQRDFCGQSLVRSGVDEGAGTETWTFECTVPDVVVGGEYRIRVFALDTLGNWTNSNGGRIQDVFGAFTIVGGSDDVSGPEIVEVLPDGGVFGPGEVFTVSVTVRDQSGIATVGFSFDQVFRDEVGEVESTFQRDFCGQSLVRSGVDEGAGTETWTFECTVPDVVVGGEYRIRVFALDTLGNWTNSNGGRIQDVFGHFFIAVAS
jgi:hypothetical protein